MERQFQVVERPDTGCRQRNAVLTEFNPNQDGEMRALSDLGDQVGEV